MQSEKKPTFIILEGRDRVGGRIHTRNESIRDVTDRQDVHFFPRDLGAAWLHGTGKKNNDNDGDNNDNDGCNNDDDEEDGSLETQNPMIPLLQQTTPKGRSVVDYHLTAIFEGNAWTRPHTILHKANKVALFRDGTIIPNDSAEVKEAIQAHYRIEREVSDYCNSLFEMGEGMQTVTTSMEEAREHVSSLAYSCDDDSVVKDLVPFYAFLSDHYRGIASCDQQLIMLPADDSRVTDETYVSDGDYEGPHFKLKHGMESVIQPLYHQVADHVFLNEDVMTVTRKGAQDISIETKSGMIVETRCCISTLPIGCLQKFSAEIFRPQLGEEIDEAIHAMSAGFYKKVFLTFDEIFWSAKEPFFGLIRSKKIEDGLGQYLPVYNFWAKDSLPCLEAVLCGNRGKWAFGRSDEDIRNTVLGFIEESMGVTGLLGRCISCHITRWEEDPFTSGSYSSFRLGTLPRHMDIMQRPHWDGDLIFAGESTESVYQGSVQAALLSGVRAATQAVDHFVKTSANNRRSTTSATLIGADEGAVLVA